MEDNLGDHVEENLNGKTNDVFRMVSKRPRLSYDVEVEVRGLQRKVVNWSRVPNCIHNQKNPKGS